MTKRNAKLISIAVAALALSGCDMWPSTLTNNASGPVTLRYWHVDYDRWSPTIAIEPNQTLRLGRGHHVGDARCIEIVEEPHHYRYDETALSNVHALCRKTRACNLRYLGGGTIRVEGGRGLNLTPENKAPAAKPCWP